MRFVAILAFAAAVLLSAGAAAAQPSLASSNPQPGDVNLPNLMATRLADQKAAVDAYAREPTADNLAAARAKERSADSALQIFCADSRTGRLQGVDCHASRTEFDLYRQQLATLVRGG